MRFWPGRRVGVWMRLQPPVKFLDISRSFTNRGIRGLDVVAFVVMFFNWVEPIVGGLPRFRAVQRTFFAPR